MARSTKHSDLVKNTLDYLNGLPCCKAFPYSPGPYGRRAVSDIIFCYRGLFGSIEVKIGYDQPSKLQNIFMRDVRIAEGEAQVGRVPDDAKKLIKDMDDKLKDMDIKLKKM